MTASLKKAYFISDIHLGATYNQEDRLLEKSVVAFLDSVKDSASEIFLLGDILDYWYEYKYTVPRGFVRFFGKLAELADNGIKITWFIGNHDIWIFDYLPSELGIEVIDGRIERKVLGTTMEMQHGDAIGGTRKFRFMRAMFRNKVCQWLYSGIHPRWTVGFGSGCSRRSRENQMKTGYKAPELLPDVEKFCVKAIADGNPAKYFIFGHLHKNIIKRLPEGRTLIVVPDWITQRSYGEFDGATFRILPFPM